MPVTQLEELQKAFGTYFNAGDVDGLVSLYEPDAVLVSAPGRIARGHAEIRKAMQAMVAAKLTMTFEGVVYSLEHGDLALLSSKWSMSGTGRDGAPIRSGGQTSEVARRGADGGWRYVIDNPFAA